MAKPEPITPPAALRREQAAIYCGVSPSFFGRLVEKGIMPAPRDLDGVKVWLRRELDDALYGTVTHETGEPMNSCDAAFGL